jgi:hypothetical protein
MLDAVLAGFLHKPITVTGGIPREMASHRVPDAHVLADKLLRLESIAPCSLRIIEAMVDEVIGGTKPRRVGVIVARPRVTH